MGKVKHPDMMALPMNVTKTGGDPDDMMNDDNHIDYDTAGFFG